MLAFYVMWRVCPNTIHVAERAPSLQTLTDLLNPTNGELRIREDTEVCN